MRKINKFKTNIKSYVRKNIEKSVEKNRIILDESKFDIYGSETLKELELVKESNIGEDFAEMAVTVNNWYEDFIEDKLKHFNILATVDEKGYKKKLKSDSEQDAEEIKRLNIRIGNCYKNIDFDEFSNKVGNCGYSFCPAIFYTDEKKGWTPRRKSNFAHQQVFALDFDEGITFEEVLKRAFQYKMPPSFIYKTLSCNEIELNKFRVVWIGDFLCNGIIISEAIIKLLMFLYPEADKACKDCCRLFYGGKGIIYKSQYPYLERLKLVTLVDAVEAYIKDTNTKDRLEKMRQISNYTKIVLKGGFLDVREVQLNKKQLRRLINVAKPTDLKANVRYYITCKECAEILEEEILEEDNIVYVVMRKLDVDFNKFYFVRMNKSNVIIKRNRIQGKNLDTTYNIKTSNEYKVKRKSVRGIQKESLYEKCNCIKCLVNDDYLSFDELFGICTNLINIEGGLSFFKGVIAKSEYNTVRSTNWANFKADEINNQGLFPQNCNNFCGFKNQCKHANNIINTIKTKRNTLQQIGEYNLVSLENAMNKYKEIVKEIFDNGNN